MTEIDEKILQHCCKFTTREACGFVSSNGTVHPIKNVAKSNHEFIFDKGEYFRALSSMKADGSHMVAIFHSHVNGNKNLTESDTETMRRFKCDMCLVVGNTVRWFKYESES